jgi:N-glycosylase/DNA lyase
MSLRTDTIGNRLRVPRLLPIGLLRCYRDAEAQVGILPDFGSLAESDLWRELCFCLLSPRTRFERVVMAMKHLETCRVIERLASCDPTLNVRLVARLLSESHQTCRFPNQKAIRIVGARDAFYGSGRRNPIRTFLASFDAASDARAGLVKVVPGFGLKEASHFLQNIGLGDDLAVLDVHVTKFLASVFSESVTTSPPRTAQEYFELEQLFLELSFETGLNVRTLDLAIWMYLRSVSG